MFSSQIKAVRKGCHRFLRYCGSRRCFFFSKNRASSNIFNLILKSCADSPSRYQNHSQPRTVRIPGCDGAECSAVDPATAWEDEGPAAAVLKLLLLLRQLVMTAETAAIVSPPDILSASLQVGGRSSSQGGGLSPPSDEAVLLRVADNRRLAAWKARKPANKKVNQDVSISQPNSPIHDKYKQ